MRLLIVLLGLFMLPAMAADEPTEWMTKSALNELRVKNNENLMYPDSIEGRFHADAMQFRAVFKPYQPGMDGYYSYWGLTDGWYKKRSEELAQKGYMLHYHQSFKNPAGADLHQATWVMMATSVQSQKDGKAFNFKFSDGIFLAIALIILFIRLGLWIKRKQFKGHDQENEQVQKSGHATTTNPIDPVKW
jgi:hypothetical protein